jgi:hypothetical protein
MADEARCRQTLDDLLAMPNLRQRLAATSRSSGSNTPRNWPVWM